VKHDCIITFINVLVIDTDTLTIMYLLNPLYNKVLDNQNGNKALVYKYNIFKRQTHIH